MAEKLYTTREICLKCVDENEVLFDEHGKHLQKVWAKQMPIPETLNKELLTNINTCLELFKLFLKQRIIMNESSVRFKATNDVSGLQAQVDKMELSRDLKVVFRNISQTSYILLKEEKLLGSHVELDCTRFAHVDAFDKQVNLMGDFDMVTLIEKSNEHNDEIDKHVEECSNDGEVKSKSKPKEKENSDIETNKVKSKRNLKQSNKGKQVPDMNSENRIRIKCGRALTTFCVTARNYVSAVDIFQQLVSLHMLDISYFYLLVWHVGPLVETQELVLYSYTPPGGIVGTCDIHLDQLEKAFREIKGKQLQVLADLKTYFKYLVYDCPGVKDSQADKKERYERYMAKKAKKRELKRQQKSEEETDSTEPEDSPDDGISMHESLWSTSAQTDEEPHQENDFCA